MAKERLSGVDLGNLANRFPEKPYRSIKPKTRSTVVVLEKQREEPAFRVHEPGWMPLIPLFTFIWFILFFMNQLSDVIFLIGFIPASLFMLFYGIRELKDALKR